MRCAELLGTTKADRQGRFEIEYSREQFRRAEKERADLFIRVLDENGRELYQSETRFNAGDVEVFEIDLPEGALCDTDEWSFTVAQVAGPIEDVAVEDLTEKDLEFLAKETGIAYRRLRFLRTDAAWSCAHQLPGALFYAMFRQGLPVVLPKLLALGPERWRSAIEASIEADIVPRSLESRLDESLARLADLADEVALDPESDEAGVPEVATLAAAGLSDGQRKVFARALREHGAVDEALWSKLETSDGFGPEAVSDSKLVLSAAPLMLGHLPTLRAADELRRGRGWTEAVDLARLSRDEWHAIAEKGAENGLPDGVDSSAALAEQIAHNIEVAFPTMSVAARFENDSDPARSDVARFLLDNPGFDLLHTRVDQALAGEATIGNLAEPGELAPRLKATARVARIVAKNDMEKVPAAGLAAGVAALLDNGFDSARKIVGAGRARFVEKMTPHLGKKPAEASFEVARARAGAAEMLGQQLRDHARDPLPLTPRIDWSDTPDDWSFLFEGSGGCACKHCRSVLGPSAYLADLLHSLETSPGDPFGALTAPHRRPDIPRIKLSCDNANTPLPYIDLVNEILGDAASGQTIEARQTSGEAALRRAVPEHIGSDDAVAAAHYPWTLPFEAGHREAQAWSEHLEIALEDVRRAVAPDAADLSRLYLGIGPEQWTVLTRAAITGDSSDVWPGSIAALRSLPVFLEVTGLSHAEIVALTETWFFSADGAGDLSIDDAGAPCDPAHHRLVGLEPRRLDQLQRFVRLSRHLGWPIEANGELDAALEALEARAFSVEVLDSIAALVRASRRIRRPIRELVSTEIPASELLGLGDVELALLRELSEVGGDELVADRLALFEARRELREAGLDIREVANILLGWDQRPSAFFPSPDDARTFLFALRSQLDGEIAARLSTFESDAEAAAALAAAAPADPETFLRRYYGERVIVARLAEELGVEQPLLERAIRGEDGSAAVLTAADRSSPAIDDLLSFARVAEGDASEPALLAAAAATLGRISRLGRLLSALGLTADDLDGVAGLGSSSGFLDLDLDPAATPPAVAPGALARLLSIRRAAALSRSLPGRSSMFAILDAATSRYAGDDLSDPASFSELEQATGWPGDVVAAALSRLALATPAALGDFATYERLATIVDLARRFDVEPAVVIAWGDPDSPRALAESLRDTASRRFHDEESWFEVLGPINDRLREARRDALLSYLIAGDDRFDSPAAVYNHYLIDPEMSSCQLTSRIKQAAASVQLFIQRMLMGLEDGVELSDDARDHWKLWEWAKSYRVWEANRKVFLYPENWIYSELRDDKSEVFEAFESEMLQDEVRSETAERALRGYVERLDEIARLDIRALYYDKDAGGDEPGSDATGVLHVFGRTRSAPHVHYHRRRLPSGRWTPWEKIDMAIDGDHLVPFVADGRLILVWVSARAEEEDGEVRWILSVSWAEKQRQTWSAVQTAPRDRRYLSSAGYPPEDLLFRVVDGDDVRIQIYRIDHHSGPDDHPSVALAFSTLRFDRCKRILELVAEEPTIRMALLPPRTTGEAIEVVEVEDPATADSLELVAPGAVADVTEGLDLDGLLDRIGGNPIGAIIVALVIAAVEAGEIRAAIDLLRESSSAFPLLARTPGAFRLLPDIQERHAQGALPFVVEIEERTYLVSQKPWAASAGNQSSRGFFFFLPTYRFENLYHPYSCAVVEALAGDVDALLAPPASEPGYSLDRQLLSEVPGDERFPDYAPTWRVQTPYPYERFEFEADSAQAIYNWELFFHAPLLVAERLSQGERFEEARRWLHFIFDPTDVSRHRGVQRVWRAQPFYLRAARPIVTIDEILAGLASGDVGAEDQIEAWKDDPFNPHLLARYRTLAYMRAVVMKYVDNLIAWGDDLFARDTIESLNEAAQLYVLASEILGPEPEVIEAPERPARSYEELGELDAFANALEDALPAGTTRSGGGSVPRHSLYFCIPSNAKLSGYRATVADRLAKIRTCRDLEGRLRQLPLYEPPIDPGLLVRARAAGLDLAEALSLSGEVSLPHYRYRVVAARALDLCTDVRALGNALASALERKDAEELSRLRARHETAMLTRVSDIKRKQVEEARESLAALRASRRRTEVRKRQLEEWAEERRNPAEQAHVDHLKTAHEFEVASQALQVAASIAYLVPDFKAGADAGIIWGGTYVGNMAKAASAALGIISGQYTFEAQMSSIEGAHDRRRDEWLHQADLAGHELDQIDRQILAAEIRLATAEAEERNHHAQLAEAREVEDFLRRKFSNQELYGWMAGQLARLHRDAFHMARDLALRAERAARQELGLGPGELRVIGFDQFDGARRGLLAGDKLHQDLRRLEQIHLERDRRELEITRHISLAGLNPEQLVALRETGRCQFKIPEVLFDIEFPGHYRRRIKSVSLSIPAVTGPTTNVGAVLSLEGSWIRSSTEVGSRPYSRDPSGDDRFIGGAVAQRSIATSSAQRDGGVFELSFRDERYLPFEGAGAESEWTLELPAAIRPFDYETISDVILHMSYTASEGPPAFRSAVEEHVESGLRSWLELAGGPGEGIVRVVSLRRELSGQLHRFLHPAPASSLHQTSISLEPKHLPHLLRGYLEGGDGRPRLRVADVAVVLKPSNDVDLGTASLEFGPATTLAVEPLAAVPGRWGELPHARFPATGSYSEPVPQTWTLRLDAASLPARLTEETDGVPTLRDGIIEDVLVAFRMELSA